MNLNAKRPILAVLFTLVLAGLFIYGAAPASAQDPQPTPSDNEVNQVAKQMFCPVCENIPLDVCPTQACAEWRELIRQKLAEGWGEDQIKEYFALQYGDRVLAEPPRRGLNWLVYILPPLGFLGGAVLVVFVLKSMRSPVQAAPSNPAVIDTSPDTDPYLKQVEEELKNRG